MFTGLTVVQKYGCNKIIAQSLVASILQWNRTKIIDDDSMNLFLSTVNTDCKIILNLYYIITYLTFILIFLVIVSRSCTQNHELSPFLTADSFVLTSYLLTK